MTAKAKTGIGSSQDQVLLTNLMAFYQEPNRFDQFISVVTGESSISLRIVDWFATNYAKHYYTVVTKECGERIKVYRDYKLHLRAYSKKRFDPFCRWNRLEIPVGNEGDSVQTTVGQLNFFKWAISNDVLAYIEDNRAAIEADMNSRNSTSKRPVGSGGGQKTRKKREELSVSAIRSVKRENVEVVVRFN